MFSTNDDVYFVALYGEDRIILSQKLHDKLTRVVISDYNTVVGLKTIENDSAYLLILDSANPFTISLMLAKFT